MNILTARIIYNFIKYSKDFKYDFYFRKYYEDLKFVDVSFCEFDHVINDFDFRKHVRNNLYSNDENDKENRIMTADFILENFTGKLLIFKHPNK